MYSIPILLVTTRWRHRFVNSHHGREIISTAASCQRGFLIFLFTLRRNRTQKIHPNSGYSILFSFNVRVSSVYRVTPVSLLHSAGALCPRCVQCPHRLGGAGDHSDIALESLLAIAIRGQWSRDAFDHKDLEQCKGTTNE